MSITIAKPMHFFCKFIGVAPYHFDPSSSELKFKNSKLGVVYCLIICSFLTWFAVYNYGTINDNLTSGSYVTIGAQWLQFYVNNGFSILIVVANSFQQWKIVKAFNFIYETKNEPKKILDYGECGKEIFYGTSIVFTTIFIHLITTLTSYYDNEKIIDFYWFPYGILFLLNTLVVLQFLCGVVKLGKKFKTLNIRLGDLIGKDHLVTANYNNSDRIDSELELIGEEHSNLINETNLLISAFSYQLLLAFLAALFISVSGLYLICKRIIQRTIDASEYESQNEINFNWWCLSCYPLLHSILIASIIAVCQWTVNQSVSLDSTLPRIQRVFRISQSASINSFRDQLLLHRISFNVFNIFIINPSMVCSIITTVLTYLIILVQFEISQDAERTSQMDVLNSPCELLDETQVADEI